MTAEADQIGPARVSLPDIPTYLRSVYDLGRRSIRPALPALALLFFYRLGTSAHVAFTDYSQPHRRTAFGAEASFFAEILLSLVLTPFLIYPLQESLLRGRPLHFRGAIRRVLEERVNVILSGIAQVLVLVVPGTLIAVLGGLLRLKPLPLLQWTELAWMLVAALFIFMIFATPAVVLDGEGPLQSIRTSFHLLSRNLGRALGRLLAFAFLAAVAYEVISIPSFLILAGGTVEYVAVPIRLAAVIWDRAVDTLFFPFWVAAVMVLYRSLRPMTDEGRA